MQQRDNLILEWFIRMIQLQNPWILQSPFSSIADNLTISVLHYHFPIRVPFFFVDLSTRYRYALTISRNRFIIFFRAIYDAHWTTIPPIQVSRTRCCNHVNYVLARDAFISTYLEIRARISKLPPRAAARFYIAIYEMYNLRDLN